MSELTIYKEPVEQRTKNSGKNELGKDQISQQQLIPFSSNSSFKSLTCVSGTRANVINEDEYVEKIEDIIVRDFYPDLEKLKNQTAFLQAENENDVAKMREIQSRMVSSRRMTTPWNGATPAPVQGEALPVATSSEMPKKSVSAPLPKKESLDDFHFKNVSEDNASFSELLGNQNHQQSHKYEQFFGKDSETINGKMHLIDQGPEKKNGNLISWPHKVKNTLMYPSEGFAWSETELEKVSKEFHEKQIDHQKTRFEGRIWPDTSVLLKKKKLEAEQKASAICLIKDDDENNNDPELAFLSKRNEPQNMDLDVLLGIKEHHQTPATPMVNGYKLIKKTPNADNHAHHHEADSLTTWGEVSSTPLQLGDSNSGAQFRIPQLPRKDRSLLSTLNKITSKNKEEDKEKKSRALKSLTPKTPTTPKHSGLLSTPHTPTTPLHGDMQLRASYMRTPDRPKSAGSFTPKISTPKLLLTPKISTPNNTSASKAPSTPLLYLKKKE